LLVSLAGYRLFQDDNGRLSMHQVLMSSENPERLTYAMGIKV
jgi:hypothetical protein